MKILGEKTGLFLLFFGLVLFLGGILYFIFQFETFSSTTGSDEVGQLGDIIGGIVGAIWSLAGVLLFYTALREQREDFKVNRDAMETQQQALGQQIEEFKLQRQELEETRKVFELQSVTQRQTQFENTFFQMMRLQNEIIEGISIWEGSKNNGRALKGREGLKFISNIFWNNVQAEVIALAKNQNGWEPSIRGSYKRVYNDYESQLSHYFRNFHQILKFVHSAKVDSFEMEKDFYISIIKAQLSIPELKLLLGNIMIGSPGFPKQTYLVKIYELLEHLPLDKQILDFNDPAQSLDYLKITIELLFNEAEAVVQNRGGL